MRNQVYYVLVVVAPLAPQTRTPCPLPTLLTLKAFASQAGLHFGHVRPAARAAQFI